MTFEELDIPGVWRVDLEPRVDERGFFARSFCDEAFAARGLATCFPQCNLSFNHRAGTLRGMHYQAAPVEEPKLVRCVRGRVWDVVLDLRPASPTFRAWRGIELSADNRLALYVPPGVAHGFLTLEDESEVFYQMGERYHPEASRGVRHDDPAFQIAWPESVRLISERDAAFPDWQPE